MPNSPSNAEASALAPRRGLVGALRRHLRDVGLIRAPLLRLKALGCRPQASTDWLVVAMYHGLAAGARGNFVRQLAYMRSLGDFVTAAQALDLLTRDRPFGGRYFCLSWDDGRRDAFTHAYPLLREATVPSVSFVVPTWLDTGQTGDPASPYMGWDDCRAMSAGGVTIGSHSVSHRRLSELDDDEVRREMVQSKRRLEAELGRSCDHFACPWGQAQEDYLPARDPGLAAAAGYRSFFTTARGAAVAGTLPWAIPRVRLEPEWGLSQLRYLFTPRQ